MTMTSIRTISAVAAMLGLAVTLTIAETHYFNQVQEGDWNDPQNWSPWGVPGEGDTAVIVGDRICHIVGHEQALVIDVQDEATLTIDDGHSLRLGDPDPDPNDPLVESTISGQLCFRGEITSALFIEESGVILATDQDGGLITTHYGNERSSGRIGGT
jgi:hypothetical protein